MNGFNLEIQYSDKAKNTVLEVWPGNLVKVIAPTGSTVDLINKIVSKKTKWIIEKQRLIKDVPSWRKREFVSGESFPFLGKEYRLKVIEGHGEVALVDDRLIVAVPNDDDKEELVKLALIRWYKEAAIQKIQERVAYYAGKICEIPASVKIKDYSGRWGSCTPSKDLVFNWQIIALPKSLFDFVIAHEVAHLKELNHGIEFKRIVAGLIANPEQCEASIKYFKNVF